MILRLLYGAGLRVSELCGLKQRDCQPRDEAVTSITLTILASGSAERRSIVDVLPVSAPAHEEPAIPSVPVQ